jgi:Ni/Co efflux regulator RcnB
MKTLTLAPVLALAAFAFIAPPQAEAGERQRREKYDRYESRHHAKVDRYEDRHREKHYRNDHRPWRSYRQRHYYAPRYRSHTYYRDYDYYDYDYDYGYYDGPRVYTRVETYCPRRCHVRHRHHFRPRVGLYLGF